MLQVKRGSIRWGSPCLRGYPEGGLHRVSHAESGGPKFDDMADNPELRAEIREFLVSRRARITPEQAGLRAFGNSRRVAGCGGRRSRPWLASVRSTTPASSAATSLVSPKLR